MRVYVCDRVMHWCVGWGIISYPVKVVQALREEGDKRNVSHSVLSVSSYLTPSSLFHYPCVQLRTSGKKNIYETWQGTEGGSKGRMRGGGECTAG